MNNHLTPWNLGQMSKCQRLITRQGLQKYNETMITQFKKKRSIFQKESQGSESPLHQVFPVLSGVAFMLAQFKFSSRNIYMILARLGNMLSSVSTPDSYAYSIFCLYTPLKAVFDFCFFFLMEERENAYITPLFVLLFLGNSGPRVITREINIKIVFSLHPSLKMK